MDKTVGKISKLFLYILFSLNICAADDASTPAFARLIVDNENVFVGQKVKLIEFFSIFSMIFISIDSTKFKFLHARFCQTASVHLSLSS